MLMAGWTEKEKKRVGDRYSTHCANTLIKISDEWMNGVRGQHTAMRSAIPVDEYRERRKTEDLSRSVSKQTVELVVYYYFGLWSNKSTWTQPTHLLL